MIRKVLTAKVLAAAAVTTVLAGGAAAATGSLPDPVQRVVAAVTPFEAPHHRDEARPSVAPPTDSTSDVSVPDLPVEDSVELSVPGNPPTSHESDDQAVEPTRSGDDASDEAHDPAGSADAPESDEPDRPAADAPLPGQPPAPPTTESHEDSSGHESGDHVAPPAKFDPSHPKEAPGSSIPHS